jgi:Recombination endonuclease VII
MRSYCSNKKTRAIYDALVERDGEVCQWCGRGPAPEHPLVPDHVDPRGGNELANRQLLCVPCNSRKGDTPPEEDKSVRWTAAVWQHGFTVIPNAVLASDALTVYEQRAYSLLTYYARQSEECWPGQEGLAKLSRCSSRQMRDALHRLEGVGLITSERRGRGQTNVYRLVAPRAARGSGQGSREAHGSVLDRNVIPGKKEESLSKDQETEEGRGSRGRETNADGLPAEVGGQPTTEQERKQARDVLAAFNEEFETTFVAASWLAKIVLRLREHPELDVGDHEALIRRSRQDPWWKPPPTPAVIYGNDRVFERAMNVKERRGAGDVRSSDYDLV